MHRYRDVILQSSEKAKQLEVMMLCAVVCEEQINT